MKGARPSPRPPLPTDPDACRPIDGAFTAALAAALGWLDLVLTPGLRAGIEAHVRLLLAWNTAINLTAIREPEAIAIEHVADALTAVGVVRGLVLGARPAVLDLGSGAGYPGLPLGLALSAGRLTLVDSVTKKARFLEVAGGASIVALESAGEAAPGLEVCGERAETLARDHHHRGQHDLVTARAVGSMAELIELGLPMLRPGGCLVAWKREGGTLADELTDAERLLAALGGALEDVEPVRVPGLEDHCLVIVRSERPTPARYPRSPAERRRDRR